MSVKIAPSLMCSDFRNLAQELALFEREGIELLHLDIMDGHFVPNITMGPPVARAISAMTTLTLDVHMMVDGPDAFIPALALGESPIVSVHVEGAVHLDRTLSVIRASGGRPAVAINPATPISMLEPVLGEVELVLVMTVNPGFAGQKLVGYTIDKIAELMEVLERRGVSPLIEVDGNTTPDNIRRMAEAGAEVIVAGTSCLYLAGRSLEESLAELKAFVAGL